MVVGVVVVVKVALKRHERLKHVHGFMALDCCSHLRAWLIEELEPQLADQEAAVVAWAETLLAALWRDANLELVIADAAFIFPAPAFERFLSFASRNYPREVASALTRILIADAQSNMERAVDSAHHDEHRTLQ